MGRDAWRRRYQRIHGSTESCGESCHARHEGLMSSGTAPMSSAKDPAEHWHALLKPQLVRSRDFTEKFYEQLRAAKLTFGNRVHCPFLRPFFLSPEDETRVRAVAEKIAELGERVANHAMKDASLLAQLHLREGELRLVRLGKPH